MNEKINIKEIEETTMYKMIYWLLRYTGLFEVRCLLEILIEERTDEEEIKILKELKNMTYEDKKEEINSYLENKIIWIALGVQLPVIPCLELQIFTEILS